jgi:2-iminobutanoate/2-iminopropanoate deaminase
MQPESVGRKAMQPEPVGRKNDTVRELVAAAGAAKAIGPYSPALKVGNLLFLSGSIPLDPLSGQLIAGGIVEQTTRVMENIKALLEAAGAGFNNVARTTVFMVDLGEFAQMNEVYSKYFTAPYPARSTVQVVKLPREVRVEIDVIAVLS